VIVDRYDRQIKGSVFTRVHQEDICQALGIPPSHKYQNEGGPGPAEISKLLRRVMAPRVADDAVRRFADALIWNWLIAGTDAHAKNYSLLLANDQVRLAPLYDIASALPYGSHEKKLKLAMKIGGDYGIFPARNRWPAASQELGLDAGALVDRVRELASLAPDAFADAANESDIVELARPLPGRLVDLIADRTARCKSLLRVDKHQE
jgi:serine/threonine-protein kinase HipA